MLDFLQKRILIWNSSYYLTARILAAGNKDKRQYEGWDMGCFTNGR